MSARRVCWSSARSMQVPSALLGYWTEWIQRPDGLGGLGYQARARYGTCCSARTSSLSAAAHAERARPSCRKCSRWRRVDCSPAVLDRSIPHSRTFKFFRAAMCQRSSASRLVRLSYGTKRRIRLLRHDGTADEVPLENGDTDVCCRGGSAMPQCRFAHQCFEIILAYLLLQS